MARKRYKPEEIVAKLRQVDVLLSQTAHRQTRPKPEQPVETPQLASRPA
jgi:hypothetical protein